MDRQGLFSRASAHRSVVAAAFLASLLAPLGTARALPQEPLPPPVIHLCDLGEPTAAELGRERLLAVLEAGSEAILAATGGALAASGAPGDERAACAAALADAVPFDVVNLAHRDLAGDPEALAKAIGQAKARFVSASFRLPPGRETPWKEFAVVERGGSKTAFIGIASRTASMDLPGSGAIPGLQFVEPAPALAAALPKAAAAADGIVILADADPAEAAPWASASPKVRAVIVSGRGGGARDFAPERKIFLSPPGGGAAGLLRFDPAGPRGTVAKLSRPDSPSAAFAEASRKFSFAPEKPRADVAAPAAAPPSPLKTLEPGKIVPAGLSGKNRAVVVEVRSIGWIDAFGPARAAAGRRLLVIDTLWRNILTPAVVRDRQVPVAYRIPRLADHLYLVAEGRRVLKPREAADVPGAMSWAQLDLPLAGSVAEGKLLFETDAAALPRSLSLRYYDFAHGFLEIPLVASGEALEEKPLAGPRKNEVVEAATFGLEKVPEFKGRKAPPGEAFVLVDLRARSLFSTEADATAFDPKARPGAKTRVGTVADWKESRRYLQLVIDGVYGRAPEPETELDPEPRFLPDIPTGGLVAFLAPEERKSLELRCDFPNAQVPGSSKVLRPAGIALPLEGSRPPAPRLPAIASADDDFFKVSVTGQAAADTFAGEAARDGRFLVLDVTVKNAGKSGEFFQVQEQLQHAGEDGSQSPPDPVTERGPRRPGALVWIPAGEERSFQVAFRIPREEKRPRLAYAGVSAAKVLELKPLEEARGPKVAAAGESPAGKPAEKAVETKKEKTEKTEEKKIAQKKAAPPPPQAPKKAKAAKDAERIPARSDLTPRGIEGVGLKAEDVNRAIDRGSDYLWSVIQKNEKERRAYLGYYKEDLPVALALVHSNAHHRIPALDAAIRKLLAKVEPREQGCYENGVLAMLLESYGDPVFLPKLRQSARYLLEAQGVEGSWSYRVNIPKELFPSAAEDRRALRVSGGTPLEGPAAAGEDMVRLTPWEKGVDGDNSASQFSLLGVHSADRSGLRMPQETWKRCLQAYRSRQNEEDGGWGYTTGGSYGSMTCAGICSLAINRFHLGEKDPAADPGIERGLAWLARHFDVTKNPEEDDWHYYYLYSLERVGRILDTEFIGENEWYPLGARYLVDDQKPDGSWVSKDQKDPYLDTCFALLFLTRATPRLLTDVKRGGSGTLRTSIELEPGKRFYVILDASGSMLDEMEGKQKFAAAREAVAALIQELPPGSPVALRVFGHRKTAIEAGASDDTALEIPMAPLEPAKFLAKVRSLRPRGKTPLARSLRDSAKDLQDAKESAPVTVVLLTDGGEDTLPRQDPLAAAREFGKLENVTLHIVGFDINREDWSAQLREMTRLSKGTYWPVSRAGALLGELRSAVLGVPPGYSLLDKERREVGRGKFGDTRILPEGKYIFRTDFAGKAFEEEFWINTDAVTAVCFDAAAAAKAPASGAQPPAVAGPPAGEKPAVKAEEKKAEEKKPEGKPQAAKFCTSCGAALAPGSRFCTGCGSKVSEK